ncbi:aldehyde dehydrogenase [Suillus spraguei]|nr:aldehyde dehydrogenase [Suillus spraguei]
MATTVSALPKIRDALRATFRSGITRPLPWRQHQLYQLARMAQNERELICDAINKDLGKPKTEVLMAEVGTVIERAVKSAQQLPEWAKTEYPDVPDWQKPWKPTIYKAPKGTALIISPWNYPMILTFQPLHWSNRGGLYCPLGGNCAKVPRSKLYRVVNGAVPETSKLLELQWDIFSTRGTAGLPGSSPALRAKHLTPLTLELGGKSLLYRLCIRIDLAAKRILWGKCNNAGQAICVAPDYILVQRDKQDDLVKAFQKHYNAFFPEGALDSPLFGSIVSDLHHKRLTSLLSRTKGEVVLQGRADAARKRLEPTIVKNVANGDSLLEEKSLVRFYPIVPVDSLDEAVDFVNARSHPLVLYAFSDNESVKQRLVSETQSGGIVFNDTFQQLAVHELPFAGVGESGYGNQVMKHTYDTFTQLRSSIDMPKEAEPYLAIRYPPHSEEAVKALTAGVYAPIPPSGL